MSTDTDTGEHERVGALAADDLNRASGLGTREMVTRVATATPRPSAWWWTP